MTGEKDTSVAGAPTWAEGPLPDLAGAPEAAVIRRRKARANAGATVRGAVARLLLVVVALTLVFRFAFGIARVSGSGMRPTAGDGDLALFARFDRSLKSDDVVTYEADGKLQLGRVVAQAGDTVEVTSDGKLLVNGSEQPEKFGQSTTPGSGVSYPLKLKDGQYFVLGDGRSTVTDSRVLGPIGSTEVEGKVVAILRLRQI
ncbi:MAG: signal peptidase I [Parafannyhessea sp.]|uniref:signal peptidase I n=1 Tax=Parafannyhessea sp. TaxID=2847324 RepID=UPI003EFC668D